MDSLLDRMSFLLEVRGYSPKTQSAYLRYVKEFSNHFQEPLDELGSEEILKYLHYLIKVKESSDSSVNCAYSALRFFYETTLKKEWDVRDVPRVKKAKKLPVILSMSEIKEIFAGVTNLKHKAILMTIYGGGLRISEAINLKITDIDSRNMQIRVREAKGKKDRYTLLSTTNLKVLREYWKVYRPKEWLFPGWSADKHITDRTVQKVFEQALERARIKKEATVHTLRHCFATHLLETGISIYHIQNLLGHTSPQTTAIYIHVTRKDIMKITSPLDLIAGVLDDE